MTVFEPSYAVSALENTETDALEHGKTYRIGEVAEILKLKSYVVRFWESEFPQLVPLRTEKGQRLYTAEHVALLRHIQTLLHKNGMTIEGARRILDHEEYNSASLANLVPLAAASIPLAREDLLQQCVAELEELRQLLRPGA